jgi:hypothetical protein
MFEFFRARELANESARDPELAKDIDRCARHWARITTP